jgi:hypothetical protein
MDIIQNIRDNIYKEMRRKHIKLDNFCEDTGYSREDVARIILGELLLPPYQLELVADVLGATKQNLMYGSFWWFKKLMNGGRDVI